MQPVHYMEFDLSSHLSANTLGSPQCTVRRKFGVSSMTQLPTRERIPLTVLLARTATNRALPEGIEEAGLVPIRTPPRAIEWKRQRL
jgi:hypothetical protein